MNIPNFFISLKAYIKSRPILLSVAKKVRNPWVFFAGWLYGAYLTIRYVDKYNTFPAIIFENGLIRLKIRKGISSQIVLNGKLIVTPFAYGSSLSSIIIGCNATVICEGDFVIGDDVRIIVSDDARLEIDGKKYSSGSGITCQSKILVRKFVKIGADTIVSWGTFITDSDHHPVAGVIQTYDTVIGEHVWLAAGVQVLKGAHIGKGSIVAAQSVVIRGDYPERVLLAGAPAKVKGMAQEWARE